MQSTDKPKPRKHVNPDYDPIEAVQKAAKAGDQAFHAWRAGQKAYMDIVPGVELCTIDGDVYVWTGEEWIEVANTLLNGHSTNVQFNTGDRDLDNLLSFAVDVSNGVAGMEDCDDFGVVLKQVLARLKPA